MAKYLVQPDEKEADVNIWAKLLDELRDEIWADPHLTDEEKRRLDELDSLSDEEWEPIEIEGQPISETIIEDRGER
jgi:hypothetical protein